MHVAAMAGRADIIDQLIHVGCDCSKVLPIDILGASRKSNRPQEPPGNPALGQVHFSSVLKAVFIIFVPGREFCALALKRHKSQYLCFCR